MNKKKLAALISALVVSTLAACGRNQEISNADGGEGYSESSAELLVGTLEYLLNEDNTDGDTDTDKANGDTDTDKADGDTDTDNMDGDTDADTDADKAGIFQIKDDKAKQPEQGQDTNKTDVVIYYGNGASDKLNTEVSAMEQLTPENLISALASHNIVPIGTKVNVFYAEKEEGKAWTLQLDLDKAFREYLKTMNKESEKIILASITATFLEAYDAESIMITVDGKVLETNHAVYEEPFSNAREYIESPQQNISGK